MYKTPTRRKRAKSVEKINLIPILDAVFIFIFFLLMSANFLQINEIGSDVPIISSSKPPKSKKKPLALTLKVRKNEITVYTGVPASVVRRIKKINKSEYDLPKLRDFLINLKKVNISEKTVILEPLVDITYEELVAIMDSIRTLKKTDPTFFRKTKSGLEEKVKELFDNIIFGNIQS